MILKVKHKELKIVEEKMLKSSEKLEYEIKKINDCLNELSSNWQGIDSDAFCNEARNYINKMKSISDFYKETSLFVKKANYVYEESDSSLKNELEKEGYKYE